MKYSQLLINLMLSLGQRLCSDGSKCFSNQTDCPCCYVQVIRLGFFWSRHHQPICIGCCGNSVAISNYNICWWHSFPTQKHEKWRYIISLALSQSQCRTPPYHSASNSVDSAQPLWCISITLDLTSLVFVALPVVQKNTLKSDVSIQSIWTETHL